MKFVNDGIKEGGDKGFTPRFGVSGALLYWYGDTEEASEHLPLRFNLVRDTDVTKVSGTGVIARGVQFEDGRVVLNWRPLHEGHESSVAIWPNVDAMLKVHGHDGATRVVWA